jgi:hypothetical protein
MQDNRNSHRAETEVRLRLMVLSGHCPGQQPENPLNVPCKACGPYVCPTTVEALQARDRDRDGALVPALSNLNAE